jgi:hypothetical protein
MLAGNRQENITMRFIGTFGPFFVAKAVLSYGSQNYFPFC